eukprot:4280199-Prymnesium_polylepis.2
MQEPDLLSTLIPDEVLEGLVKTPDQVWLHDWIEEEGRKKMVDGAPAALLQSAEEVLQSVRSLTLLAEAQSSAEARLEGRFTQMESHVVELQGTVDELVAQTSGIVDAIGSGSGAAQSGGGGALVTGRHGTGGELGAG